MQGTRVRSPVGELDPTCCAVRPGGVKLVYPVDFFLKKDEHRFLILVEKWEKCKYEKKTLELCSPQWFLSGVSILTQCLGVGRLFRKFWLLSCLFSWCSVPWGPGSLMSWSSWDSPQPWRVASPAAYSPTVEKLWANLCLPPGVNHSRVS